MIKMLEKNAPQKETLSVKYAGSLPGAIADDMQKYVSGSRKEWSNNI